MSAKGAGKPPAVPQHTAAFDRFDGTVPRERALFVTGRSGPQHLVSFGRLLEPLASWMMRRRPKSCCCRNGLVVRFTDG